MAWFEPSGICGCCADSAGPCTVKPDGATLTSSNSCMQPFAATWSLGSVPMPACLGLCSGGITTNFDLSDPANTCTYGSDDYTASSLNLFAARYAPSNIVWVYAVFVWKWTGGPSDVSLRGTFYSTDGGATMGSFTQDGVPTGCSFGSSVTPPYNGADLTCALTFS